MASRPVISSTHNYTSMRRKKFTFHPQVAIWLLILISMGNSSIAEARTAETTRDGDWHTKTTWTNQTLPGLGDSIVIAHKVTSKVVIKIGGSLVIKSSSSLTAPKIELSSAKSRMYNSGDLKANSLTMAYSLLTAPRIINYPGGTIAIQADFTINNNDRVLNQGKMSLQSALICTGVLQNEGEFATGTTGTSQLSLADGKIHNLTGDAKMELRLQGTISNFEIINEGSFTIGYNVSFESSTIRNRKSATLFYIGGDLSLNKGSSCINDTGATFRVLKDFKMLTVNSKGVYNQFINYGVAQLGASKVGNSYNHSIAKGILKNNPPGTIKISDNLTVSGDSGNSLLIYSPVHIPGKLTIDGPSRLLINDSLIVSASVASSAKTLVGKNGVWDIKANLQLSKKDSAKLEVDSGRVSIEQNLTNGLDHTISGSFGKIIIGNVSKNEGTVTGSVDICDQTSTNGGGFDNNTGTIHSAVTYCIPAPGSQLPVKLIHFNGVETPTGVQLTWTTAMELNNDRFEVMRSLNAKEWETIGSLPGGGTISYTKHYSYSDNIRHTGKVFYRLRQVDFNGADEHHNVISINLGNAAKQSGAAGKANMVAYPNPAAAEEATIVIYNPGNHEATLRIVDAQGRPVLCEAIPPRESAYRLTLTGRLPQVPVGLYILHLQAGQQLSSAKLHILP